MKEIKKAMLYMGLGAVGCAGVMYFMSSGNKKVNDLMQKECSMMDKVKKVFKK